MPLSTSDTDSGPDDIEPVNKKNKTEVLEVKTKEKPSKPTSVKRKAEDNLFQLGKMRYINVSEWKGKAMVNIREYYTNDAGDMKPGKKGISLSLDQWARLKQHTDEIDELIKGL